MGEAVEAGVDGVTEASVGLAGGCAVGGFEGG